MQIEEVKKSLNKMVSFKGIEGVYKLTACILRKKGNRCYYSAELLDTTHGNSVIICNLSDIEVDTE